MPIPTPDFLLQGGRPGRYRAMGMDEWPCEGDGGSLVLCHWVAAEPELWEGSRRIPGRVRPPKRRGKHFGSMVVGAMLLSPALPAQNRWTCRSRTWGQNCAGQRRRLSFASRLVHKASPLTEILMKRVLSFLPVGSASSPVGLRHRSPKLG